MSKVYICVDTGDGDILGVYFNKSEADEYAESLLPAYKISVEESDLQCDSNWDKLKKLAGYYQNATEEVVTLSQDDATRSYWIKVGKEANYGSCFEEALSKFEVEED
jgi:hypothetical protein